jgi:nitroreductase
LTAHRAAEKASARRHAETLREARRPERLSHLVAFMQAAQRAERVAKYIHQYKRDGAHDHADETLDELWIKLRPVQLLCSENVAMAAHALTVRTHHAVAKGAGGQAIGDFLQPGRDELINAARGDLDAGPPLGDPRPWRPGG